MKRILCILMLLPFVFASCVDEDETLGMDLVDENDKFEVGVYDRISMNAIFFKEDSLVTLNYRYNTLGEYSDSKFGAVKSSLFTQITLSTPSAAFNTYDNIDSVILTLAYAGGFSEDTMLSGKQMRLNIYELSEEIDSTKKYSFDNVACSSLPIYSNNIQIDYNSDVIIESDTLDPQLRVKIEGEFFEKIKNFGGSNDDFVSQFKGLKFELTKLDSRGLMAYIDMEATASCITVYYTQGGTHQKYLIKIPTKGNRFMHYDYDFTSSDISSLANNDTIDGNDLIYLGNMGISLAKININDFKEDWLSTVNQGNEENDVSINSAILEFPVSDLSQINNPSFTSRILCYRKAVVNQDTALVLIHDAQTASGDFYDGYYDSRTNSYKMRITMHLENYINGNISDPNIYLIPDARRSSASRVILNGPNNTIKPARIKVTYSKKKI